jgi:hypothetical protein
LRAPHKAWPFDLKVAEQRFEAWPRVAAPLAAAIQPLHQDAHGPVEELLLSAIL